MFKLTLTSEQVRPWVHRYRPSARRRRSCRRAVVVVASLVFAFCLARNDPTELSLGRLGENAAQHQEMITAIEAANDADQAPSPEPPTESDTETSRTLNKAHLDLSARSEAPSQCSQPVSFSQGVGMIFSLSKKINKGRERWVSSRVIRSIVLFCFPCDEK
ncbi:hypothetical protein V2G26_018251 [Clonostachys chloroleuca]